MPTLPDSSPRQHISSYTWTSSGRTWTPGCNRDPGLSQGDLQFIKPTTEQQDQPRTCLHTLGPHPHPQGDVACSPLRALP